MTSVIMIRVNKTVKHRGSLERLYLIYRGGKWLHPTP